MKQTKKGVEMTEKEVMSNKLDQAEDLLQEVWNYLDENGVELGNSDGLIIEMRDQLKQVKEPA
jgi:hypothetical protein|tara:strand:- start:608 stop:796 length:189 start_codon:yes stop_codon:yes gene_type:complete